MTTPEEALGTLNAWLAEHGQGASTFGQNDWAISAYREAFLFSPSGGRRSNRLYLVRGIEVTPFSPATTSLDEAYAELEGGDDNPTSAR